jgi:hypothetical protein
MFPECSLQGAEFELATCELSPEMKIMYNRSTDFWKLLTRIFLAVDDGINPNGDMKKMNMVKAQVSRHAACRQATMG